MFSMTYRGFSWKYRQIRDNFAIKLNFSLIGGWRRGKKRVRWYSASWAPIGAHADTTRSLRPPNPPTHCDNLAKLCKRTTQYQ